MRKLAAAAVAALVFDAASAAVAEDVPYQVAYYYKVRWGFQQEFERLFLKNHYPVLMEMKQRGRVQDVKMFRATFHLRDDWTFLVMITYPSWAALGSPSDEEAITRKLYPDYDRFQKEEQRRFEILDSHWDVPLTPVAPPR
ncbi:MAG: hypothetical protein DMF81_02050 [Acidobacteria bacterium]|nr:MAG: hypothetical protein DMF81_02050 [Acidobacteriota bacterium]